MGDWQPSRILTDVRQIFLVNTLQSTTYVRSTSNLVIVCITIKSLMIWNFVMIWPKISTYCLFWTLTGSPLHPKFLHQKDMSPSNFIVGVILEFSFFNNILHTPKILIFTSVTLHILLWLSPFYDIHKKSVTCVILEVEWLPRNYLFLYF